MAPVIALTSPPLGTMTSSRSVRVRGRISDTSRIARLVINGRVARVPSTRFDVQVALREGLNVIEVVATDSAGNTSRSARAVIQGRFARPGAPLPGALALRINRTGLQAVERLLSNSFGRRDFGAALLRAKGPLTERKYRFVKATVLRATEAQIGRIDFQLTPSASGLKIRAAIQDINLLTKVEVDPRIGPTFVLTTRVKASQAVLFATASVRFLQRDVLFLKKGLPLTRLQSPTVRLDGFSFNVRGIPNVLERRLRESMKRRLEGMVAKAIETKLAAKLTFVLGGVLSKTVNKTIRGVGFRASFQPESISVDSAGLLIRTGLRIQSRGRPRSRAPGSLRVSGALPTLSKRAGFDVGVRLDSLNQAAFLAWESGLLDLDLHKEINLPAAIKNLDGLQLGNLLPQIKGKIKLPDSIEVEVRAGLPPVFTKGAKRDTIQVGLGDLEVRLYARDRNRISPRKLVARVGVHLEAEAAARVSGRELKVSLGRTTRVSLVLLETPLGVADLNGLQTVIDMHLPTILKLQSRLISGIPLPLDGKLGLRGLEIRSQGAGLALSGELR
ncbi:MAG: hypothetical protein JKY65_33385 [Planctomycetes bacterium]|nr:hypothetical protein [Planctomycetota bacterium]